MSLPEENAVKNQAEVGKKSIAYVSDKGRSVLRRPGFPLAVWEPVAWWWSQLQGTVRASERTEGTVAEHQVSYLELLVEFELATRRACDRDDPTKSQRELGC